MFFAHADAMSYSLDLWKECLFALGCGNIMVEVEKGAYVEHASCGHHLRKPPRRGTV